MTTITTRICDHCQSEITSVNRGIVKMQPHHCSRKTISGINETYDLCWDCYKDLAQWLNPGMTIEEEVEG